MLKGRFSRSRFSSSRLSEFRGAVSFSPALLFAAGEQGVWYDPSDLTTLFQDDLGTIPAAYGQPVGLMLDKSGRGNHASQPTVTARPTLMQDAGGRAYLQFDGVDDCLAVPAFDWGSDKAAIVAGVRRIGTSIAALLELNDLNNGNSFAVLAPQSSGNTMQFGTHGPAGAQYELHNYVDNAAPSTAVWSAQFDRAQGAGAEISVRRNGVVGGTNARADNTTGNFGNHPLHIGARSGSSLFFNGHLYSLAAVNRLMTPDEMGKLETYAAQKTGVTL